MALRAAARGNYGIRRLFCTASSTPSPSSSFINSIPSSPAKNREQKREEAEPNTNLFVSGLFKRTTTEKLQEAFSKYGQVVKARVMTDRVSGYSKGYGFVEYASLEDAKKAKESMDGQFLDGVVIFAEYAKPRPPPSKNPGNNVAPPNGRQ
ncbi:hypothetical protein ACFE04_009984 [Oxalis oulophora]